MQSVGYTSGVGQKRAKVKGLKGKRRKKEEKGDKKYLSNTGSETNVRILLGALEAHSSGREILFSRGRRVRLVRAPQPCRELSRLLRRASSWREYILAIGMMYGYYAQRGNDTRLGSATSVYDVKWGER